MIRIALPQHLQTLARVGPEVEVSVSGPATQRAVLRPEQSGFAYMRLGLDELKAQSQMYSTIYDRLSQMLNKGRGPSEAVAAQPTKEFDAQMGNPDEFVRRAFESLWAYLSPDA